MIHFLDASALVKRYVKEAGTEDVRRLVLTAPSTPSKGHAVRVELRPSLAGASIDGHF